ncbi:hypothetical protein GCM10009087_47670 [Sphingomonas oligophenolica]|uniref:Uncharacterized protein n=1 Tax=Sphingomonas oligophenolica TaxID=301154 RepID=A0ABU9Y785_9SPHN
MATKFGGDVMELKYGTVPRRATPVEQYARAAAGGAAKIMVKVIATKVLRRRILRVVRTSLLNGCDTFFRLSARAIPDGRRSSRVRLPLEKRMRRPFIHINFAAEDVRSINGQQGLSGISPAARTGTESMSCANARIANKKYLQ